MKGGARLTLFVLIGGFSSLVNLLARIVIDIFTSFEVAIVLAFPIALTTAFVLNRALVFNGRAGNWRGQYWRFLLVNLATLVQVFVLTMALARFLFPAIGFRWHADTVAHAIGLVSPILTSYWAHKYFSFSPGPGHAPDAP